MRKRERTLPSHEKVASCTCGSSELSKLKACQEQPHYGKLPHVRYEWTGLLKFWRQCPLMICHFPPTLNGNMPRFLLVQKTGVVWWCKCWMCFHSDSKRRRTTGTFPHRSRMHPCRQQHNHQQLGFESVVTLLGDPARGTFLCTGQGHRKPHRNAPYRDPPCRTVRGGRMIWKFG